MDFAGKRADPALRGRLECELRTLGAQSLYERLIEKDPRAAGIVHPNNTKRVVRALERLEGGVEADGIRAFEAAGKAATEQFDPVILRAAMDRAALYALIEARVDAFLENGLESEVIGLLRAGVPPDGIALQGIGYREIVSCLNGEYDRNEAIRLIKRNTRHLAKRQETWFKRYENVHIIDLSDAGQAVAKATDILRRELRGQTGKIT
jgi:tRNA dimethylallyltransferase